MDMEEVDMQATPQEAEHMAEGLMVMRGIYKHGSTVVPLYVAGAMSHHQNNHQRHGSNEASPNHAGSSYLVLTTLAVSLLTFFA